MQKHQFQNHLPGVGDTSVCGSLFVTHSDILQLSVSTLQRNAAMIQVIYGGTRPGLFWGHSWGVSTYVRVKKVIAARLWYCLLSSSSSWRVW